MITFLTKFIFPISDVESLIDESILKHSPSHFLYGLQFVLGSNNFLRYFKLKLPFQCKTFSNLLKKCKEVLDFYFKQPPNFTPVLERLATLKNNNPELIC